MSELPDNSGLIPVNMKSISILRLLACISVISEEEKKRYLSETGIVIISENSDVNKKGTYFISEAAATMFYLKCQ